MNLQTNKDDSRSIFRVIGEGTLWVSSSTLVVKVIGLVTVFLVLRQLGAAEYGILELTLSITALLSIFMLPGLESTIVADMGEAKGSGKPGLARNILSAFIILQLICSVVAWTIVFFGAHFFAAFYSMPPHYAQVVAFLFLLSPIRSAYGILFRVNLQFFHQSMLSILEELVKFVALVLMFFTTDLGVYKLLFVMVGSQAVALVALSPHFFRGWRSLQGGVVETQVLWNLIRGHGKWSIFSTYAGNFGKSIRLWIIQRVLGTEAVGIYAVAIGLIGHTIALAPLGSVIAPMLPQYVQDRERFTRLLNKGMKYQLIAYLGIGTIGFLVFPPILLRIFPDYAPAMPLFQVMLIGLVPVALISIFTPAFFALKLQKSFFYSMVFKTFVSIVFTYGLIAIFGIWGLAYEYILTSVIYGVERIRILRKHVPDVRFDSRYFVSFDSDDRLLINKMSGFARRLVPLSIKRGMIDKI